MSSFSGNVQQVLRQSEEDGNLMTSDQILIRSGDPLIIIPTSLPKLHGKCKANQRPGKDGNSMKCDQELIRSVEPLMNTSIKFVLKRAKSSWSFKGHEMTEIRWSVTKSPWGLRTPLIRISTNFEVNTMISMSRNVQQLNAWMNAWQFKAFFVMWMVATISSKFLALSYFFGMAPILFQKVESLTFQKMYGGICHLKWYRWTNFMDIAHGLIVFQVTSQHRALTEIISMITQHTQHNWYMWFGKCRVWDDKWYIIHSIISNKYNK